MLTSLSLASVSALSSLPLSSVSIVETPVGTIPDLLRLLVLPVFGYVAYRDIRTRRVPNRTWYPLAALAVVLLVWELFAVFVGDATGIQQQRFLIRTLISIGFLIPLTYLFWLIGGFGGADAKAFFVVAVLFPTYPEYALSDLGVEGALATLPVVETTVGVFSLTILTNTVLLGALYPVVLAGRNALAGQFSLGMFFARPLRWDEATGEYGVMLEFADRSLTDIRSLAGLRSYFSYRGLDLDALRMYLQWRGCTLAELRANADRYRDPDSLPAEPHPPGDGSFPPGADPVAVPDETLGESDATSSTAVETPSGSDHTTAQSDDQMSAQAYDDPWGAEAFLDDIEGSAYGTSPEVLRAGLDALVERDRVWISPGIPFLVPMFFGLVVAFTYGDVLFAVLTWLGVA
jgi:preflagellin peptidase FlaK